MSSRTLMTAEEFAQLPPAETEDFELVEGELIPLSSGNLLHGKIRHNVERLVGNFLAENRIGVVLSEIDCRISTVTVRRPDVVIFLNDRLMGVNPKKIPGPFAPHIAVEVLSPSEAAVDVNRKVLDYLRSGSKEVWLLDEANGELFVQTNSPIRLLRVGDVLETPVLPGFSASVADLLAGFDPIQPSGQIQELPPAAR